MTEFQSSCYIHDNEKLRRKLIIQAASVFGLLTTYAVLTFLAFSSEIQSLVKRADLFFISSLLFLYFGLLVLYRMLKSVTPIARKVKAEVKSIRLTRHYYRNQILAMRNEPYEARYVRRVSGGIDADFVNFELPEDTNDLDEAPMPDSISILPPYRSVSSLPSYEELLKNDIPFDSSSSYDSLPGYEAAIAEENYQSQAGPSKLPEIGSTECVSAPMADIDSDLYTSSEENY